MKAILWVSVLVSIPYQGSRTRIIKLSINTRWKLSNIFQLWPLSSSRSELVKIENWGILKAGGYSRCFSVTNDLEGDVFLTKYKLLHTYVFITLFAAVVLYHIYWQTLENEGICVKLHKGVPSVSQPVKLWMKSNLEHRLFPRIYVDVIVYKII